MPETQLQQCRACGRCCHDHTVLITFRDLREIHFYYPEIEIQDIIVLYDAASRYADKRLLEEFHPGRLIFEDCAAPPLDGHSMDQEKGDLRGTWQAYLGLRFLKSENGFTTCPFLDEARGKCKIHSHKPLICRTYPHVIDENNSLQRLEKVRCNPLWGDPQDLLPEKHERVYNVVARAYHAHDEFLSEVLEWNEIYRGKTVPDFIQFLLYHQELDAFDAQG